MFTLEARIRVRGPLGAWGCGTALLASRGRGRGSAGPQPVWDRVGQVTQPPVSPATWEARLALQGPRDPGRGVREVTQPVFTKLLRQEPDAGAPGVGTQTDAHLVGARREARGNGPVWGGGCRGHRCSAWGAARRAGPWRIDGQARGALHSGGEAWSCRKNRASVRCDAVPGCRHALGLPGRVSQDGATAAHPDNCTVAASFGSRAVLGTVPRPHTCSRTHTHGPPSADTPAGHPGRQPGPGVRPTRLIASVQGEPFHPQRGGAGCELVTVTLSSGGRGARVFSAVCGRLEDRGVGNALPLESCRGTWSRGRALVIVGWRPDCRGQGRPPAGAGPGPWPAGPRVTL